MDINYFKEFVVLADTGAFVEAAERLFISQSTLSKHLQNFETELGVSLFERSTRKVVLSESGHLLLPYAEKIVEIQNEYTAKLLSSAEIAQGIITICSIPALDQYNITDVLTRFKKGNPNFTLNVIEAESSVIEGMLRQNKCDFAFVRESDHGETMNDFIKVPYAVDTLTAVMPSNHPLAREKSITLDQLRNESFLLLPEHTFMYDLCMAACKNAGFSPNVVFTGYRGENIVDLVGKRMGISLLTKKPVIRFMNEHIAFVDINPTIYTYINLYYRKGIKLSAAAEYFIKCLKEE